MPSEDIAAGERSFDGTIDGLPEWAQSLYSAFFATWIDITQLLVVTRYSLGLLRENESPRSRFFDDITNVPRLLTDQDKQKIRSQFSEFIERENRDCFTGANAQAAVSLWSTFESCICDLLTAFLVNDDSPWMLAAVKRVKIRIGEYHIRDEIGRASYTVGAVDRGTAGGTGAGRFEALLGAFGLKSPILDADQRRPLIELHQVRNAVVHRAGIADQVLIDACPWLDEECSIGSRVFVTEPMLNGYTFAALPYMKGLFAQLGRASASV